MQFEGIYTPIITPHAEDGAIDKDAFAEVVEFLIASGVHCIVVGGSTGEYYAQTNEERIGLMNFAHEVINKRVPLMIGTGATRTEEAVMFAKAAKETGADAILVNSPPYAVPTDLENAMHALRIDRAANLPIMLYNYPGRTGTQMGEEYLERVGRSKNFCGIKESSGDINRVHLLARDYPNIGLCCGMDDQALEFFVWGARCWVCAGSNFLPKEHNALYEACALEGNYTKGRRIMSALLPLMRVLEQGGKFVQSVKYGCELAGLRPGPPRLPLQPLTPDEKSGLEQVIRALKTEVSEILVGN
ncbi:MAG: dihydrodipicolinate synthase family protein [Deltaproteobacteria bacterium]|nr:dihydrodipicolinate synthase family protein [Deltaproteobacteria bacterium]